MKRFDIQNGVLKASVAILADKSSVWQPLKGELAVLMNSGVMVLAVENAAAPKSISDLKADGVIKYGPSFVGTDD